MTQMSRRVSTIAASRSLILFPFFARARVFFLLLGQQHFASAFYFHSPSTRVFFVSALAGHVYFLKRKLCHCAREQREGGGSGGESLFLPLLNELPLLSQGSREKSQSYGSGAPDHHRRALLKSNSVFFRGTSPLRR